MSSLKKIIYLSATHWDREWYKTFWSYNTRLVDIIDEALLVLEENDDFTCFNLDGQTSIIEDYLTVRPENKEKIEAFLSKGRLTCGPFYTMPDEQLVSGESLVKNLLVGEQIAKSLNTGVMKCGYLVDIFGHIAQMPQILNEFNIEQAIISRGINDCDISAYFNWISPDKSECVTYKTPQTLGYGAFYSDVLVGFEHISDDELMKKTCAYVDREMTRTKVPYLILMDGLDHLPIHKKAIDICKGLADIYKCEVLIASPDTITKELKDCKNLMDTKESELFDSAKKMELFPNVLADVLSSRVDIKLSNDSAQTKLEKWAIPLMTLSNLYGNEVPINLAEIAYKYLLKNHAHDSICGCSIDNVHRDMHYRYNQAKNIADEIAAYSVDNLFNVQQGKGDNVRVTLVNPLTIPQEGTFVIDINFSTKPYSNTYSDALIEDKKNAFLIFGADGNEVEYSLISIKKNSYETYPRDFLSNQYNKYTVALNAKIPEMSAINFVIKPSKTPVRNMGSLKTADNACENDNLSLEINSDGTFNIKDKLTNKTYINLHTFEDNGEIGDGWCHSSPTPDRVISSKGSRISIETVVDNAHICTFKVTYYMLVPEKVDYNMLTSTRSDNLKELVISSLISLEKNSRFVDIKTSVQNNVLDHRLALKLQTGITTDNYYVNQAFAFINRKTGISKESKYYKEAEKVEKGFEDIVFKRDENNNGLAFISKSGLHEASALDDNAGSIRITLLRSFRKAYLKDEQKDCQIQIPLEFCYRILPINENDSFGDLIKMRDVYKAGIKSYSIFQNNDLPKQPLRGIAVDGRDVVVSLVKYPENREPDTFIIRLVNFKSEKSTANITVPFSIKSVYKTNMLEENILPIDFKQNSFKIEVDAYKIVTYKVCITK